MKNYRGKQGERAVATVALGVQVSSTADMIMSFECAAMRRARGWSKGCCTGRFYVCRMSSEDGAALKLQHY